MGTLRVSVLDRFKCTYLVKLANVNRYLMKFVLFDI